MFIEIPPPWTKCHNANNLPSTSGLFRALPKEAQDVLERFP
jgi:hypothetical protein